MNVFVACVLEIHLIYVEPNLYKTTKFVYIVKKSPLEAILNLDTLNRNSNYFIWFPGGSNPWKISVKMFLFGNFQVSFPSQIFFKNPERECSWPKSEKNFKKIEKTS